MPASQNFVLAKGYPAAAAITKKRAVKFVGDGTQSVTPITAVGDIPCGVAMFSVSSTEITKGKKASIMTKGRAVMEAAGAINEGQLVYLASDGRATTTATSATRIGVCDEPAAGAGSECSVSLDL
jgi:predicted RecA/RadA family phage recombinase